MNAKFKEIAYGAAYNAFLNYHRIDREGLSESKIEMLNWLEPSMADAYAQIMVASGGNVKEALRIIHILYKPENLIKICNAIKDGEIEELLPGLKL